MNKALSSALIMVMVFIIGMGITSAVDLKYDTFKSLGYIPLLFWFVISLVSFYISYGEEDE